MIDYSMEGQRALALARNVELPSLMNEIFDEITIVSPQTKAEKSAFALQKAIAKDVQVGGTHSFSALYSHTVPKLNGMLNMLKSHPIEFFRIYDGDTLKLCAASIEKAIGNKGVLSVGDVPLDGSKLRLFTRLLQQSLTAIRTEIPKHGLKSFLGIAVVFGIGKAVQNWEQA